MQRINEYLLCAALLLAPLCLTPGTLLAAGDSDEQPLRLEDLRAFTEVYTQIRDHFYEDLDDRRLFEQAIAGMLTDVDPYTSYLSKEEYAHLNALSAGEYAGIGVEISTIEQRLDVVNVLPGSPAHTAGIRPGDRIVAVDGVAVRGRPLADSLAALRGKPGTEVRVKVLTTGDDRSRERALKLTRALLHYSELSSKRLINDYLLVQIKGFQQATPAELREAIANARQTAPVRGLILDLRDNPGGVLNSGVAVADLFLTGGLIVSTRTRGGRESLSLSADDEQLLADTPIVVLIDGKSASAAEIVAGALQDSNRATIIGERSFGKGSVQSVIPLVNGGALKLTTAHYYTPAGQNIHENGIQPDIEVANEPTANDNDPILTAAIAELDRQTGSGND